MLHSQFNLDHRLAELLQTGAELRQAQAVRRSNRPARTVGGAIRSLFRGTTPATDRPAGLAAA